jgi:lactoylglutathione lyase
MFIEHIAIWVKDIETMRLFYVKYFGCIANAKYENTSNRFESYFLNFKNGARIELMKMPQIPDNANNAINQYIGINHIAIKMDSKEDVDLLTDQIRKDGYIIISEPRKTGDGYYESCIFDPENNRIEIVA